MSWKEKEAHPAFDSVTFYDSMNIVRSESQAETEE